MLNVLGTSKFIDYSFTIYNIEIPFVIAIGVLPYPFTFLCTDLISELLWKEKSKSGSLDGINSKPMGYLFVWIAGVLDPPENLINGLPQASVENGQIKIPQEYAFYQIRKLTIGATIASMVAYLAAQFIDVNIFHFLKAKTKGKKLWLRNNVSTLISQLIDSTAVIVITHFLVDGLPKNEDGELTHSLIYFIFSGYLFKLVVALMDTLPFYYLTYRLKPYFEEN